MKNKQNTGIWDYPYLKDYHAFVRALIMALLISLVILLTLKMALAQPQTISVNAPDSINENQWLNISFLAESDVNKTINYSIYMNNVLVSKSNGFSIFMNYSSSGTYDFSLISDDGNGTDVNNISVQVNDMPLTIKSLSPQSSTYNSRLILFNITTSNPVDSCSYAYLDQIGLLNKINEKNFESVIIFPTDGLYSVMLTCSNAFDNATLPFSISINSVTPNILTKSYTVGVDYSINLAISTDVKSTCKYDFSDNSYNDMKYFFYNTNNFQHSTSISSLDDGNYDVYIRCISLLNSAAMASSQIISFTIAKSPSASISISHDSPLKAGTYTINVVTSKNLQSSPVLYYTYSNDNSQHSISLTGSDTSWIGYMIIDDSAPTSIGTFHFSGTDMNGLIGSLITQGELFIVDTTKPIAPSSIEANPQTNGDIELKWYYDGEDIVKYNIYRSTSQLVDYVDYYTSVDTTEKTALEKYTDNNVDGGTTYYYKVAAVDSAGNDGALSDIASAVSSSQVASAVQQQQPAKTLDSSLVPKVDDGIAQVDSLMMDVDARKSAMDQEKDPTKLKIINMLGLIDQIANANSTLEGIKSQLTDLKSNDMSASDLDVKLNKYKLDSIKATNIVMEDIQLDQSSNYEQYTQEPDIDNAISSLTVDLNITKDQLQNYSLESKRLQDSVSVKAESYSFRIKYLNQDNYLKFTLVKKSVSSTSNINNVVIVETVPEAVEKKASNINFNILNQKLPVIITEDPVLAWNVDTLSSADIYYQIADTIDPASVKGTKTIVLPKPEFKPVNTSPTSKSDITGFLSMDKVQMSSLGITQWIIVIGTGITVSLILVYVFVVVKSNNISKRRKSDHKIISQSLSTFARPLSIAPDTQNKSNVPLASTMRHVEQIKLPDNYSKVLHKISQANGYINDLDYMKSLSLYTECVNTIGGSSLIDSLRNTKISNLLDHIYLKLSLYKTIHDARALLFTRQYSELDDSLRQAADMYKKIEVNISLFQQGMLTDKAIKNELKFMLYISESKNQLAMYRK